MRIKRIHIDGFGLFHDKTIDGFGQGVNILYGLNEKGKSTLLDFLRFTLFDYPTSIAARRPPLRGGNHGGRIELLHSNGSELSVYRAGSKKFNFLVDGHAADEMRYKQLIGSANKPLYDNVYAITLDELLNLSSLKKSGAEERIFTLGMGINADLGKFQENLKKDAERLYLQRGSTQVITSLQKKIESTQDKIKTLQGKLSEFDEKTTALDTAKKTLHSNKAKKENLKKEARRLEGYLQASADFVKYDHALKDLADFQDFEQQPKQLLNDYKVFKQRILDNQEILDQLEIERKSLEHEKEEIVLDERFQNKFKYLEGLKAKVNLYAENLNAVDQESERLQEVQQKINQILADFPEYSLSQLLALRGLKKLSGIANENETAQRQLEDSLKRNEDKVEDLKADLAYEEQQLKKKEEALDALPISNKEGLAAAKEKSTALKSDHEKALRGGMNKIPVFHKIANWSALVILLTAAVFLWLNGSVWIAVLSFIIAVVLILAKVFEKQQQNDSQDGMEIFSINEEKRTIDDQILEYEQKIKEVKEEREKYDRLKNDLKQQKKWLEKSKGELQKLDRAWRQSIAEFGLSEKLHPRNVETFVNTVDYLQEKHQEEKRLKKEIEKKNKLIEAFRKKVLAVDDQYSTAVEAVKILIERMESALQKKNEKEHKALQIKNKSADIKMLKAKIENYQEELEAKIKKIGAKDEHDFYKHFERQEEYEKLHQEKRMAKKGIQTHCSGEESFEKLIETFKNKSKLEFKQDFDFRQDEIEKQTKLISETEKRIGELTAEKAALLKEKELLTLQNEREVLLVQYEDAMKEWFVKRMAMEVLNDSKKQYEKDKQPAVIRHTKKYFKAITNNAYRDLRISLADKKVELIDDAGKTKSVKALSRGTREQLLLALRMGLIEEYENNVEPLPLALDDVMVNFDNPRAERLAEVLSDFAKDRQVLLFTCHEHSRDMFLEQGGKLLSW